MIKIAIWSQKGGVGKSTVTALLGLALRDMGKKVGLLDIDLSGSSLHKALGLAVPPRLETSTARRKLIPPEVMGMRLFSICAHFGEENAVMWKGETGIVEIPDEVMDTVKAWLEKNKDIEERVKTFLAQNADVRTSFKIVRETDVLERPVWLLKQSYVSNRAEVIRQMLSTQVEWPENTEILLADMPPSTASEVFSFFDNMSGLLGCVIVTQPSEISALGMTRTIDFLRHKEIPIMGLVTMMDGYLCPHCGKVSHQLLSPKLAMEKVAKDCGIPFLISIPQTPDVGLLKPYFDRLAKMVLKCRPITLRKQTLRQQLQQIAGELGVKAAGKFM